MSRALARVRWEMGQTLLPDHFIAQEESLLAESALRFRMQGLPAHGVASLSWNETLLQEGILSLTQATLVMASGLLLELPGNARVAPLNLEVPGTAQVSAYLHLLDPKGGSAPGNGELESVPRLVNRLVLSADASYPEAVQSLKLLELKKDPEGLWRPSPDYIPPLLQVGTSPFLRTELDELLPALEVFQYKLMMDSASYLSGSGLFQVKQCLKAVYRMQRLLVNASKQVHPHPYVLFEALKDFYIEICLYRDSAPKDVAEAYEHDRLGPLFQNVLWPLKEQMQLAEKRSPYLPFTLRDGVYRLELPAEAKSAKAVYFLVQKNKIHREISLASFKIAGHSRLSMAHKLALPGIPLSKVDRPMLAHAFGPEVEFYQLELGEEWGNASREGVVAFFDRPDFNELEFYLYWSLV